MGSPLYWILALCLVTSASGRGTSCGCQVPASCINGIGGSMSQIIALVESSIARFTGVLNLVISLIPTTTSTTTIAPPTTTSTTTIAPPTTTSTTTIAPPTTTAAPTTAAPATTGVNEATFAEATVATAAAPAAADFLQKLFGKKETTTTTTTAPEPLDFLTALINALSGAESRADPIKEMVDELTMQGDRHNCFGLFDGVVDSVMGIAGPILGLGTESAARMGQFMKQSVREADKMGLFEAISQIMSVTGVPIPDTCKCDCGCRAAATVGPPA